MLHTILVPLDGSTVAEQALPVAVRLAKQTNVKVLLLRAVPFASTDYEIAAPLHVKEKEAATYLQSIQERLIGDGLFVSTSVLRSDPVRAILFTAQTHHSDLIVLATHGRSGLGRLLLGSVADQVLQQTTGPVLLVRATEEPDLDDTRPFTKMLIPLDGSTFAEEAVTYALGLTLHTQPTYVLLQALSPARSIVAPGMTPYTAELHMEQVKMVGENDHVQAQEYLNGIVSAYFIGRDVSTRVLSEHAAKAIVTVAATEPMDLIVMTSHGRTGLDRLRHGSVAAHVVHHATTPVLVLHNSNAEQSRATPLATADPVPSRRAVNTVGAHSDLLSLRGDGED